MQDNIEKNYDPTIQDFLVKYSAPSKFCLEPYGTIWMQKHDGDANTLFIQISKNAEESNWIKVSDFLEKVFEDRLNEINFIQQCLAKIYKD